MNDNLMTYDISLSTQVLQIKEIARVESLGRVVYHSISTWKMKTKTMSGWSKNFDGSLTIYDIPTFLHV